MCCYPRGRIGAQDTGLGLYWTREGREGQGKTRHWIYWSGIHLWFSSFKGDRISFSFPFPPRWKNKTFCLIETLILSQVSYLTSLHHAHWQGPELTPVKGMLVKAVELVDVLAVTIHHPEVGALLIKC